jgi:hypothetical protein
MHVSPRRLPKLLGVLVFAFAEREARGLHSALALLRGFVLQLSYRWASGTVLAAPGDRAVLLWSAASGHDARIRAGRKALGVLVAVTLGFAMFSLSSLLVILPLGMLLRATGGGSASVVARGRLLLISPRLLLAALRAWQAYRHDARLMSCLPAPVTRRWRLDYLAASPAGTGQGGRLLRDFLRVADDSDAEVALNCEPHLVRFYRPYGFREVAAPLEGQRVMLRPSGRVLAGAQPCRRRRR